MASPLVSVVLAARDAERTIVAAVRSVLGQTEPDLELLVVDDGSVDATGERLAAIDDPRLRVLHNADALGLAGALNVGFDAATGTYIARMDADDLAVPGWLAAVLGRIRSAPGTAAVGCGMIDLHEDGRLGTVHHMPAGARAVRWAALFSSPFFHSTVALDRTVLERHVLRYDHAFEESEDYDLWARLLRVAEGDNVRLASSCTASTRPRRRPAAPRCSASASSVSRYARSESSRRGSARRGQFSPGAQEQGAPCGRARRRSQPTG